MGEFPDPFINVRLGVVGVRAFEFVVKLAREEAIERVGRELDREQRPSIVLYLVGKWLLNDLPRFTDSRFSDFEIRPFTVPIL